MERNEMVLEQISDFVEQNRSKLNKVKSENPALYGVVLDTIQFLNKKYGGVEAPKPIEEPVEEKSKEILPFEKGDVYTSPQAPKQVYLVERMLPNGNPEFIIIDWDDKNGEWGTRRWVADRGFIEKEIELGNFNKSSNYLIELQNEIEFAFPKQTQPTQPAPQPSATTEQPTSVQDKIKEIKATIEGLKLLDDEESKQQIKELKAELKTLKSKI